MMKFSPLYFTVSRIMFVHSHKGKWKKFFLSLSCSIAYFNEAIHKHTSIFFLLPFRCCCSIFIEINLPVLANGKWRYFPSVYIFSYASLAHVCENWKGEFSMNDVTLMIPKGFIVCALSLYFSSTILSFQYQLKRAAHKWNDERPHALYLHWLYITK